MEHTVADSNNGNPNISIGTPSPEFCAAVFIIDNSARFKYQSFPFLLPPNRKNDNIHTKQHVVTALENIIIVPLSIVSTNLLEPQTTFTPLLLYKDDSLIVSMV